MNAVILTEGGQRIGFGHITRCRALRDALAAAGISTALVVQGDASVRKQFGSQIDQVFDWLRDRRRLDRLLRQADVVVVDSYLAPLDFYKDLSSLPVLPVFLDDYMRLPYPQGILVNGGIGAERFRYFGPNRYPRFLGTRYALVRKEFWRVRSRKANRSIRDILVTFGGIDRGAFLGSFLRQISSRFSRVRFHAVSVPRNMGDGGDRERLQGGNVKFYSGLSALRMRDLMLRCDLAISGGGQTTNELARCGLPTLGICFAKNQRLNLQGWERSGFLIPAGYWKDRGLISRITRLINRLGSTERRSMSRAGRKLVDGQGAARLAKNVKELLFKISPVQARDSRRLFLWANDPHTRAMSFRTAPIRWAEHRQWFRTMLKTQGLLFWMISLGKKKIGSMRFQKRSGRVMASVVIAPLYRGQGLGARLVRQASQKALKEFGAARLHALIKSQNIASKKIFRKAGYEFYRTARVDGVRAEHWIMRGT